MEGPYAPGCSIFSKFTLRYRARGGVLSTALTSQHRLAQQRAELIDAKVRLSGLTEELTRRNRDLGQASVFRFTLPKPAR